MSRRISILSAALPLLLLAACSQTDDTVPETPMDRETEDGPDAQANGKTNPNTDPNKTDPNKTDSGTTPKTDAGTATTTTDAGTNPKTDAGTDPIVMKASLMMKASVCSDIDNAIREEIRASLRTQYAQGRSCSTSSGPTPVIPIATGAAGSTAVGAAPSGMESASGAGGSRSSGTKSSSGSAGSTAALPTTTTETNTQVIDVDEPDFVKSDGKNLYILHEQVLELVQAWPVESLQGKVAIALEGAPREMFVVGNATDAHRKIVVISEVDAAQVYAKAGVAMTTGAGKLGANAPSGGAGGSPVVGAGGFAGSTGVSAGGAGGAGPDYRDAEVTDPPTAAAVGVTQSSVTNATRMTKVSILDATDSTLSVVSQVYYDGAYQSARRQGNRVHTLLSVAKSSPSMDTCPTESERLKAEMVVLDRIQQENRDVLAMDSDELGQEVLDVLVDIVLARNKASLESVTYEDYVPHRFLYDGTNLSVSTLPCERMFLPKAGSSLWGVTYVGEVDLANPAVDPGSYGLLGQAQMMYENGTALVLANNATDYSTKTASEIAYVHRFGVGEQGLTYEASGKVNGRLKDKFSIDVKADTIRLVLSQQSRMAQKNRLEIVNSGAASTLLQKVGEVAGIGDGEDVRSVRYVGDTAYVVTFVQTDPLFTIDLSNSSSPRIMGKLAEIPGFSTYMHPIDDNHLLTIGSLNRSTLLQIFDVTDKTKAAVQLSSLALDSSGTSVAVSEYKAFTYYAEQKLLAIPFVNYSSSPYNAMLVFSVEIDKGFQLLGQVDGDFLTGIPNLPSGQCRYYGRSDANFSRSVFYDDVLYAIAQRGIAAARAQTPSEALGQLVFSGGQPQSSYSCTSTGTGGSNIGTGGGGGGGSTRQPTGGAGGMPTP